MPIERAEIHRSDLLARRAGKRQPRDAGRDCGTLQLKELVIHTHTKNVGGEADRLRNTRGGIE
jgi:hypothetical protein